MAALLFKPQPLNQTWSKCNAAACPTILLTHHTSHTSQNTAPGRRGWDAAMPPEDALRAGGMDVNPNKENGGEAKVSGGLGLDSSQHSQRSQQRRPLPALEHQSSSQAQGDTVVHRKLSSLGAGCESQFALHAPSIFHIPSSIWSHGVLPHEQNAKEKRQAKRRTRKTTWRRRIRHFIHIPTIPFLKNWRYHRECLVADATSGLILAVMLIPQVGGCGGVDMV